MWRLAKRLGRQPWPLTHSIESRAREWTGEIVFELYMQAFGMMESIS